MMFHFISIKALSQSKVLLKSSTFFQGISLCKEAVYKKALVVAFISCGFFLSSCAITSGANHTNSLHQNYLPSANKGLLVASITREIAAINTRGAIAFFFIRDKKTGIEFEMSSNNPYTDSSRNMPSRASLNSPKSSATISNTLAPYKTNDNISGEPVSPALVSDIANTQDQVGQVLAFELEPGMYEISKWKVVTAGGVDFANFDSEHRPPVTFEVKPGEISYLCNCHIDVDIGENIFGLAVEDGAEAAIYDKMQRDMQYIDEVYPSLSDLKVNNVAANLRVIEHPLAP